VLRHRGNVGEVLSGKDDRGAIAQLARDLELEQVCICFLRDDLYNHIQYCHGSASDPIKW